MVVGAAGEPAGGKAPHKVINIDTEDVLHGDNVGHNQPDVLEIISGNICHKGKKGETTQSKMSGGKEEWPHLLAVAKNIVEVAADTG